MKLNTKRTVLVGFAFLSICAFWQMYDNLIPKILTETFGIGESISGIIMAADNILALFLLPLFGGLSDKCTSKLGRRRPFILFGTVAAVILMMALPALTDSFHAEPATWKVICFIIGLGLLLISMGTYRSPAVALMPDVTPKPLRSKANAIINLMGAHHIPVQDFCRCVCFLSASVCHRRRYYAGCAGGCDVLRQRTQAGC